MARTSEEISEEKKLMAKYTANVHSDTHPALTPDERVRLSQLLAVAV